VLKTRSYNFMMAFFLTSYTLGLYVASLRPQNTLKIIGQALVQHNHSFMIYNNKIFKPICIIGSLVIVSSAHEHLTTMIADNNVERIIDTMKSLQSSWAPLYLFNQLCAMHFAKNYAQALQQTHETYKHLEKTNQELFEMNQKLKNTLSLLEEKNKELNTAIKTRELFIAGVSHEFRNPLNSMMGNIELLSLEIKDPKWKEMLNTCKICGDVLLGLINNILDVAKINAEKLELSVQPVNFYRLIEKAWSVLAIKIREKGLKGHLYLSANLPQYLEMDSHRLNQILLNIVGNATKFTNDGFVKVYLSWHTNKTMQELKEPSSEYLSYTRRSVDLTHHSSNHLMRCDEPSIDGHFSNESVSEKVFDSLASDITLKVSRRNFSAKTLTDLNYHAHQIYLTEYDKDVESKASFRIEKQKQAGVLKIEVFDSGCGINSSALDKLFQPFTQADSSITRRFGGTGLGLYITKQLIQKMEGEMYAYSEEHHGTNFCILIPTQSANSGLIEDDDILHRGNHQGSLKALVVDDIPLNQTLMTQYLKRMNIQAEIANNGEEAVMKFKEKGYGYYSFISMDIQMPVMDGLTASKRIRQHEASRGFEKNIPIMMVTGNCTEMEKNYCLNPKGEIRASYFFRKPFVFEECKACVKNLLNSDAAVEKFGKSS